MTFVKVVPILRNKRKRRLVVALTANLEENKEKSVDEKMAIKNKQLKPCKHSQRTIQ